MTPSSRLRVLPVWLTCVALGPLRVYLIDIALDAFSFGPGMYPLDHWSRALELCVAPPSLIVYSVVLAVAMIAALPAPYSSR